MSYSSENYKNYILDQLVQVEGIRVRRMFGGFGLYRREKFFGIISGDFLFFKTNDNTRDKYIELGSGPFKASEKQVLKNYYEVPVEIIESPSSLREWVEEIN